MAEPTGLTRQVWLHLLREQGRWTAFALQRELDADKGEVDRILHRLKVGGFVHQYPRDPRHLRFMFGVTAACKVPRGITVQELVDCDITPFLDTGVST